MLLPGTGERVAATQPVHRAPNGAHYICCSWTCYIRLLLTRPTEEHGQQPGHVAWSPNDVECHYCSSCGRLLPTPHSGCVWHPPGECPQYDPQYTIEIIQAVRYLTLSFRRPAVPTGCLTALLEAADDSPNARWEQWARTALDSRHEWWPEQRSSPPPEGSSEGEQGV